MALSLFETVILPLQLYEEVQNTVKVVNMQTFLRVGTQLTQIWLTLAFYTTIMAMQFFVTGKHGHLSQAPLVPVVIMLSGFDY